MTAVRDLPEVVRLRTINEVTTMLTLLVNDYKQHVENGGRERSYADAITDVSDRLAAMVFISEGGQHELDFLTKARAL